MHFSPDTVVGYHGCSNETFRKVIHQGSHLEISQNDYDWLGHGIYFWEGSYKRASQWAKKNFNEEGAVIGAFIRLGNCLDLLDPKSVEDVKIAYEVLVGDFEEFGKPLPENELISDGFTMIRNLDCAVIMQLHEENNNQIIQGSGVESLKRNDIQNHEDYIDSVRGMFPEGKELYPGAGFREESHIQLCITNPNCILGYFDPRQTERNKSFKKV